MNKILVLSLFVFLQSMECNTIRPLASAERSVAKSSPIRQGTDRKMKVKADLHRIIARLQRENVRPSWGKNRGECFTDQDLQEMISTKKTSKIVESLRSNRSFLDTVLAVKSLPEDDRSFVADSCRVALHKTWTERGIVDANGQTEAGVQAELMIANAVVDLLEDLINLPSGDIEKLVNEAKVK